jgi:hypothetical protein
METPQKFETKLTGRRVTLKSLDWQRQLTGELLKVEKYLYVLRLDNGGVIGVMKHAVSAIAPVTAKEET